LGDGATTTKGQSKAMAFDFGSATLAAGKSEGTSETAREFMVECESRPAGTVFATCQTVDNCGQFRVGLRKAGLPGDAAQCAPTLDGRKGCTFVCAFGDDPEVTERLRSLCEDQLKGECVVTGSDADPATCQK
jgi:hypothetical protein